MFDVLTLNKIAKCGLDKLDPAIYNITDDEEDIDFIEELESERLLHRCEGKQRRFANIMTASTNI